MTSYYSFRAHGKTAEGIRVDCSGHVTGEEPNSNGFPPQAVMQRARELVLEQFPTFKFSIERQPGVTGYPTLRYLKKKPGWAKRSPKGGYFPAQATRSSTAKVMARSHSPNHMISDGFRLVAKKG